MNKTTNTAFNDLESTTDAEPVLQQVPSPSTQGPVHLLVLRAQQRASEQALRVVPSGPALVARNAFD